MGFSRTIFAEFHIDKRSRILALPMPRTHATVSRRRPIRALALSLAPAMLFACASAPLPAPPQPPPEPASTPLASAAPPAKLGLVDDELPATDLINEITPAGELAVFAGRFEPIPIPPKTPAIIAVAGRSGNDIWMLTRGGSVLHWDGARVSNRGAPRCFTDSCCGTLVDCSRHPKLCTKEASADCQPFSRDCAMQVDWSSIQLTPTDVIVRALVDTGGMRASMVDSRLGKGGRWACEQGSGDLVYPGSWGRGDGARALELSVGGASMRFEGPARLVNALGGHSLVIDGRRVPLPEAAQAQGVGLQDMGFAARAPGDLWLWGIGSELVWRGNGLSWVPFRVGLPAVFDIWFGDPGSVWMLGDLAGEGTEQLIRWDPDKGAGQRFATPGATSLQKGLGPDFWLLGKTAFYHWNGHALERAEAPLAFEAAWQDASGELWVVGGDPKATIHTDAEDTDADPIPAGAVFRLPARGGKKP